MIPADSLRSNEEMNRTSARRVLSSYVEIPVVRLLVRLRLSPNSLTLLGLMVAGASAYLLSIGQLWVGGIVLLVSGLFDLFDGALARATGRASRFGAFLDSLVDRVSEIAVLLGLLVFYVNRSETEGIVLVYLALAGSLMVSYMRARAEGLNIDCNVGVMTRPERIIALGLGLIVSYWWLTIVLVVLAAIAALTILTSAQRMAHTWRTLPRQE